jgi:hypothetical protein
VLNEAGASRVVAQTIAFKAFVAITAAVFFTSA